MGANDAGFHTSASNDVLIPLSPIHARMRNVVPRMAVALGFCSVIIYLLNWMGKHFGQSFPESFQGAGSLSVHHTQAILQCSGMTTPPKTNPKILESRSIIALFQTFALGRHRADLARRPESASLLATSLSSRHPSTCLQNQGSTKGEDTRKHHLYINHFREAILPESWFWSPEMAFRCYLAS